jgi:hypothetical protein
VWTRVTSSPNGTTTVNTNGTFTFTPTTGFSGTTTFTYNICDVDNDCSTATVTITVIAAPTCAPGTFDFTGNSAGSGTAGNIRTFTAAGVSVKASAFSRVKSNGSWSTAFLGAFDGGLGVTDGSEGNGSGDQHTVDNEGDRTNYILFEFSQPVRISRAYLGYVVSDSDMSVWYGTKTNPYTNHQTLSDSLLSELTGETNSGSSSERWADLGSDMVTINTLVIAAKTSDSNDEFKVEKLEMACASGPVQTCTDGQMTFSGDSSGSGTAGNLRTFSLGSVNVKVSGFSRVKSSGSWNTAYVGLFEGGLGVTDGSENGADQSHTLDNEGTRTNYLLFEFSQPVKVSRAYLGYVLDDSDMSVWYGTKSSPYTNHQTLSDSLLSSLTSETNSGSSSTRWADLGSDSVTINTLVIAAKTSESNDGFKVNKLELTCDSAPSPEAEAHVPAPTATALEPASVWVAQPSLEESRYTL